MPTIHLVSVAANIDIRVPVGILESQSAARPALIGSELADLVDAYTSRERLGYYPALGYFREYGDLPGELLDAAWNLAWLSKELVQEEVRVRLGAVFSQVRFDALHSVAFTLPRVLPRHPNARVRLARHYTPDRVRVGLILSALRSQRSTEGMEDYARQMLSRWLKDHFTAMEVTSSQVV